jgi:hypothetical protein
VAFVTGLAALAAGAAAGLTGDRTDNDVGDLADVLEERGDFVAEVAVADGRVEDVG